MEKIDNQPKIMQIWIQNGSDNQPKRSPNLEMCDVKRRKDRQSAGKFCSENICDPVSRVDNQLEESLEIEGNIDALSDKKNVREDKSKRLK